MRFLNTEVARWLAQPKLVRWLRGSPPSRLALPPSLKLRRTGRRATFAIARRRGLANRSRERSERLAKVGVPTAVNPLLHRAQSVRVPRFSCHCDLGHASAQAPKPFLMEGTSDQTQLSAWRRLGSIWDTCSFGARLAPNFHVWRRRRDLERHAASDVRRDYQCGSLQPIRIGLLSKLG